MRLPSKSVKIVDQLKSRGIQPGLDTISRLLERLGNPQLEYKSIHIAGTNGKGSTAAMLREMLVRAGYKTALYTSPHLHRFSERVVINHEEISEADLDRLEEKVAEHCEGLEPTYFEFTTAMAFLYFAEQKPDIAVIEVGLGGRLDATNLVDTLVSVITPLSIDHPEFLGSDIRDIAFEKAGIIKHKRPVVVSKQPLEAMNIIEEVAGKSDSPLFIEGRDFESTPTPYPYFTFVGRRTKLEGLRCRLLGRHQLQNSAVALATAEVVEELGFSIGERYMREGITHVKWEARMEIAHDNPIVVIDGTHNVGGAKVLVKTIEDEFPRKKVHLLMGMQVTKDLPNFLSILAPCIEMIHATSIREMACYSAEEISARAERLGLKAKSYSSVSEALEGALIAAEKDVGMVLVAGSFYLAGEVGELLNNMKIQPTKF